MEIDERIVGDLRAWDAIEDHRTGTAGDSATVDWLAGVIADIGLTPVIDTFPFTRRVLNECAISVDGTRLEGVPLFDGGITGSASIPARLGNPGEAGRLRLSGSNPKVMRQVRRVCRRYVVTVIIQRLSLIHISEPTRPY